MILSPIVTLMSSSTSEKKSFDHKIIFLYVKINRALESRKLEIKTNPEFNYNWKCLMKCDDALNGI